MQKNFVFWSVATISLILDQVTKYLVVQSFTEIGDTFPLWEGVFHLTYVTNTGAAFSFFSNGVAWLRWLSLIASVILIFLGCFSKMRLSEQIGCGFILAGALGNGVDRFLFGYVVDFLDFRLINFAIFNLADVFINIGILCLLYSIFKTPPKAHKSNN